MGRLCLSGHCRWVITTWSYGARIFCIPRKKTTVAVRGPGLRRIVTIPIVIAYLIGRETPWTMRPWLICASCLWQTLFSRAITCSVAGPTPSAIHRLFWCCQAITSTECEDRPRHRRGRWTSRLPVHALMNYWRDRLQATLPDLRRGGAAASTGARRAFAAPGQRPCGAPIPVSASTRVRRMGAANRAYPLNPRKTLLYFQSKERANCSSPGARGGCAIVRGRSRSISIAAPGRGQVIE